MTLCSDWLTLAEVGNCGCTQAPNPSVVTDAITAASEILYVLSGRQYPGLCDVIFRPCGHWCNCDYDVCGCNRLAQVFLGRDVYSVSEVDVGGVIVDPDDYRLESGWLVRLDGGVWPCCQDMAADPGAADTFTITGMVGNPPSALAMRAANALVEELVKACTPDEVCAFPARVTSIVRQGVAMAILDPMEFLSDGRTGLYVVDLFLSTVNPNGLTRPSRAWSPDLPTTRRYIVPIS